MPPRARGRASEGILLAVALLAVLAVVVLFEGGRPPADGDAVAPGPKRPTTSESTVARRGGAGEPSSVPARRMPDPVRHGVRCRLVGDELPEGASIGLEGPNHWVTQTTFDGADFGGPSEAVTFEESPHARVVEGGLEIDTALEAFAGRVVIPGRLPAPLAWSAREDGSLRCDDVMITSRQTVCGEVTDRDGRPLPDVEVHACGDDGRSDADGAFCVALTSAATRCAVRVVRVDGAFNAVDTLETDLDVDGVAGLQLVLPSVPVVGLGVRLASTNPIRVEAVAEASGADVAGILAGDVIVSLDGQDVRDWDPWTFTAAATGEAGSWVEVGIERDGRSSVVRVERVPLPAETWKTMGP